MIIFTIFFALALIGGVFAMASMGKTKEDKRVYGIIAAIITIIFVLFAINE